MTTERTTTFSRRGVLKATAATGAAAVGASAFSTGAVAQSGSVDEWLSGTSNYDGLVDETGKSEVTVEVGSEANGGAFGFGPAAIHVDPGTTVTWKWVKGNHNVQAKDGAYESKLTGETGFTFSQTFEEAQVSKYFCKPHKRMGMKGAVVVGDAASGNASSSGQSAAAKQPNFDGWFESTSNFDSVVDETGKSEVTVEVGSEANGGAFGFGPAAIRVDPGTTVTWKWVQGTHNVQAKDGAYESELTAESGHTFSQTFEEAQVSKYFCKPHKRMGMKGAVVVGDGGSANSGGGGGGGGSVLSTSDIGVLAFAGALVGGMLSPFALKAASNSSK